MAEGDEEQRLRSVAIQNANSILLARRRAEQEMLRAKEALELKTQELAQSLALMSATLQATWDGILVTDERGPVTAFNGQFVEMWRVPRERVNLMDRAQIQDHIAGQFQDRQAYLDRIAEIHSGAPPESRDVLELADGRVFERFSKTQVVDGRDVGRVWSFRDITERRRVEEALRGETHVLELLNRTGATLSSQLDLQSLAQAVTDAGTELSGAQFGAFFYNTTDENGDAFMLCALSGARREDFERFVQPRATSLFAPTFRGEGEIRPENVLAESRYGLMAPPTACPPGICRFGATWRFRSSRARGRFSRDCSSGTLSRECSNERSERTVVGIAGQAAIAIDNARLFEAAQKAAEERRQLLESEQVARSQVERSNAMKDEFLATVSHELGPRSMPFSAGRTSCGPAGRARSSCSTGWRSSNETRALRPTSSRICST